MFVLKYTSVSTALTEELVDVAVVIEGAKPDVSLCLLAHCFGHFANLIANNFISQVYQNYYYTVSISFIAVWAFSKSLQHNEIIFQLTDLFNVHQA